MGEKDTSMMLLSSSHLTYLRGLHHLNMLKVTALTDIPHRHLIDWWGQGRGPVQKDFLSGSRAANFRFSYRSFRCPVDHFVNRVQGSVPFFQASFFKSVPASWENSCRTFLWFPQRTSNWLEYNKRPVQISTDLLNIRFCWCVVLSDMRATTCTVFVNVTGVVKT